MSHSYKNEQLDPEIVDLVANQLSRNELKQYIKLIKQQENKSQVIVAVPKTLKSREQDVIQKLFLGKKIVYTVDSLMLSGIKIVDNDIEYELSLNQIFQDLVMHLAKYD